MTIIIGTTQPHIIRFLVNLLEKEGHICQLYSDNLSLISALENMITPPDLLIIDYKLENHVISQNPFYILNEKKIYLPLIFYNDPCIGEGARLLVWRGLIEEYARKEFIPKDKTYVPTLDELDEVFYIVNDFIESDEFSPYIYLMQQPKPFPENMTIDFLANQFKKSESQKENLKDFENKASLPKNLSVLLKILYENSHRFLTISHLRDLYSAKKEKISEKSLKVLISNLRSYFNDFPEFNYSIIKNNYGYRLTKNI